ncbi:hypothetical protein [Kitasatospora sp. NPDC090308]|uniref:hypothetical protein n=1 Tax=Kitasatospora sp. NPDC090308 TaxID=3364082 RepID=UPI00380D6ADC
MAIAFAFLLGAELLVQVEGAIWENKLMFSAVPLFGGYVLWRLWLVPYVEFGDKALRVNNSYALHEVPYGMIEGVEGNLAIVLEVRSRSALQVRAFDPSPFGRRRTQTVREEIRQRAGAVGRNPEARIATTYTFGAAEFIPVLAMVALLAGRLFF